MSGTERQRAARERASRLRQLHAMHGMAHLLDNEDDIKFVRFAISKTIAGMGAETPEEKQARWSNVMDSLMTVDDLDKLQQTAKPYKITDADIKRYLRGW